ncbi:hypothetical protein GCM10009637_25350 [Brevibacterium luteolum]
MRTQAGGLFDDRHLGAGTLQSDRGGQSADPRPDDGDLHGEISPDRSRAADPAGRRQRGRESMRHACEQAARARARTGRGRMLIRYPPGASY